MKIKSVSESDILISNNKSERVCAKINVKNRSKPSIKIDAGWYKRVRIFYENRQPKRVKICYKRRKIERATRKFIFCVKGASHEK